MSPERLCSLLFWSQAQDFLLPGLSSFSHSFHTPKCPSWLNSLVSGPQSFSDSPGLGQSYSHGDFRFSRTLCWAPSEPLCCGIEGTWWSSALTTGQMNRGHLCWRLAQGASQAAQWSKKKKKKTCLLIQEIQVRSPGLEDPLEEKLATHFSILVWRIPETEEPGGLHPQGLKELDMTE